MDDKKRLLIRPIEGFTPQIGYLVSMMNYARHTTLRAVQNLTVKQLDYRVDGKGNSIGALLEHMAAAEFVYQLITFEEKTPTDENLGIWKAGLELGEYVDQIKNQDLDHYLQNLEEMRAKTLAEFAKRDDEWLVSYNDQLHQNFKLPEDMPINNYWCWFHVFEDEINHRGQIRLIKKKIEELGI